MTTHPTRQEMLKAVETGEVPFQRHLDDCPDCREFFALLTSFHVSGPQQLAHAPSAWIDRAIELGTSKTLADRIRGVIAKLAFDSWSASPALGVRGPSAERRRLRFTAGDIQIDLQAIRKRQQWDFVAHIDQSTASGPTQLKVGRKSYAPDDDGFITWHGATPPSAMAIVAGDTTIELPQVSWDEPQA